MADDYYTISSSKTIEGILGVNRNSHYPIPRGKNLLSMLTLKDGDDSLAQEFIQITSIDRA